MTAEAMPMTGASPAKFKTWDSIDWVLVEKEVKRLQFRIAKATREKRFGKVKSLQWLLTHSYYAKLLAVKRVTQNKGAKTPGVDGVTWKSSKQKLNGSISLKRKGYKPKPLRRIYIPKSNGKSRPLGIPSIKCRAYQALHLLALEPVSETLCDPNSYGFRPKRSCADAIEQCFKVLHKKGSAEWILEGDISSCFDKISHDWLIANIPMDKAVLKKWLKCGFVDKGTFNLTKEGTPQGGIISPTLLNLTMRGLEDKLKSATKLKYRIKTVVYADDFIVTGMCKTHLDENIKPVITNFLAERGLKLSEEKTTLVHVDHGFDFLGHNIRKYNGKLLIKPSKKSIKKFLGGIRREIKSKPTIKTEELISILNPKIRGWANFFRHVVSKDIFSYVDNEILKIIWTWAKRRHPNQSKRKIWRKYFPDFGRKGVLGVVTHIDGKSTYKSLLKAAETPIRRHTKIKMDANPYDPAFETYFRERERFGRINSRKF